ncbi:hypothetical protein WOLCODRAFT_163908 [Wolfiporia cocos MD-104 SS10]|uniref:Uncharacterized protein n=1 Tax=Wolfiporia cocos (strain MD-104) TaxID=742152 RepID=A0A2H3JUM4_WOLCO|nr:hypothetical protein WOLCODRAFT_163908 [Wolfiporia cocos MD-104 SS10]
MRSVLVRACLAALLALFAYAQTETAVNTLGETVVEVITLNNVGLPTTETLSTITGAVTTTTPGTTSTTPSTTSTTSTTATTQAVEATATTTTPPQVVEQPAPTAAGMTTYYYTTTNAAGSTVVLLGTFTPTFAPTTTPIYPSTGSILQYSDWLSMIGTSTAALSGSVSRWKLSDNMICMGIGPLAGLIGGAWLVLA